jgi:DNA-binding MarR family transcriptional regulator
MKARRSPSASIADKPIINQRGKDSSSATAFQTMMPKAGVNIKGPAAHSPGAERFCWDMITIDAHLAEIRAYLAGKLKVSVPQWILMSVLEDRGAGEGVSVRDVSKCMAVDASFVTTQSKLLEAKGLVLRVQSSTDARVILMSLSQVARDRIEAISGERGSIRDFMFVDLDADALETFLKSLAQVRDNISRASRLVSLYSL